MSVLSIFKKKSFWVILVLVLAIGGYATYVKIANDKYVDTETTTAVSTGEIGRTNTYTKYLEKYAGITSPDVEIDVDILHYSSAEGVEQATEYEGRQNVLVTTAESTVEWKINVPETGLYNVYLEYYPIQSKGIDIERSFLINGEVPFKGADQLTFTRIWKNGGEIKSDNRGNEIRPSQIEAPDWESTYLKDYMGYVLEPYNFYFEAGENTISLVATNEPMAISKLAICQKDAEPTYAEYQASIDTSKYQNTDMKWSDKVQGEDSTLRSSPTLYAIYDRSSSNTEPYSASKIKLNSIGGNAWRIAGQWIEWEITVPEDGMYELSFRGRQNYNRGFLSSRKLLIDGVTPFAETSVIGFNYDTSWSLMTLSDENGTPYQFALTAGTHKIRMEVTMGDVGEILTMLEESVYRLNTIYRKIIVLTGTEPDVYRDYRIDKVYPEIITQMQEESDTLFDIVDRLASITGQKGSGTASAENIAKQLERFVKDAAEIPKGLKNFKDNISALGTSVLTISEGPLDIDYIIVSAPDAKLPDGGETIFGKVAHEFRSFFASFFEDYTSLGSVYEDGEIIDVWMLAGRDQSNILKTMIDDTFTAKYGIGVNVRLVSADVLLPSVVAGTGPDVALTVNQGDPINYALRGASVDLTQFEGWDEIASQYSESGFIPFEYDGGVYAIPETMNFNVLFYRTDIMEELGLEVPETWDDVIEMLPVLQKSNMSFGLPSTERTINSTIVPDTSAMMSIMYQNGATLYNEDASATLIDDEKAVEAFEFYTMLYTNYGLPKKFDFANRFRSGEMPIGIADYNTYNTLAVFAPEIRGLWEFALVPGTKNADGSIDRSVAWWGQASMMLSSADNKDAAWTFLKWWSDSETQVRFGRELESVMGSAARYATANRNAFEELPWSANNSAIIKEQWDWVDGTPEVAGGYYTGRHMINAFRKVIYQNEDPRETLLDYARKINKEIKSKRNELGIE